MEHTISHVRGQLAGGRHAMLWHHGLCIARNCMAATHVLRLVCHQNIAKIQTEQLFTSLARVRSMPKRSKKVMGLKIEY